MVRNFDPLKNIGFVGGAYFPLYGILIMKSFKFPSIKDLILTKLLWNQFFFGFFKKV